MIHLNKIPNQEEKINEFIKLILDNKRSDIEKINKQMQNISEQSNSYFFNSIQNPTTPGYGLLIIVISILSLLNVFIQGFRDGISNAQKMIDQDKQQYGGNKKEIQKQINNLNSLLNQIDVSKQKLLKHFNLQSKQVGGKNEIVTTTNPKNTTDLKKVQAGINSDEIVNIANDTLKTASKIAVKSIGDIINFGLEKTTSFLGDKDILDTPYDQLSPELNRKIILIASVLNQILNNPATKESIREIAQIIAISLVQLLQSIQPEVDEITNQSIIMLKNSAENFSRGASNTGLAVVMSILGEIPYLGGIIDLVIAVGKGFNTLTSTFSKSVGPATQIAESTKTMYNNLNNTYQQASQNIRDPLKQIGQQVYNTQQPPLKGGVGTFLPNHKIHGKINAHRKRIAKTLKIFNKTLPKLKYTHSNKPYVLRNKSKQKQKKKSKKKNFKK